MREKHRNIRGILKGSGEGMEKASGLPTCTTEGGIAAAERSRVCVHGRQAGPVSQTSEYLRRSRREALRGCGMFMLWSKREQVYGEMFEERRNA
jgi:hypothetical protein